MTLPSNLWKSPVIKARLQLEANFESNHGIAEKPFYWALVPYADSKDGFHVLQNYKEDLTHCDPHMMQQEFAKNLQRELQAEAHFDGMWLVGFTHPPTSYGTLTDTENCWNRLICIWHDEDGDPQYTVESDLPFINQIQSGVEYYIGLAFQAHEQWKEIYSSVTLKEDMGLDEDQQTKAAQEALKDL